MSDRPILFNAPMVRAVLAGTKTQTRRLLKVPNFEHWYPEGHYIVDESGTTNPGVMERYHLGPFGEPGGTLWVRESFREESPWWADVVKAGTWAENSASRTQALDFALRYRATAHAVFGRWTPSIHMPRWASRITLEVAGVCVERLQDITEEDALAEGVEPLYTDAELAQNPDLTNDGKFKNYLWHGHFNHGQGNKQSDAWPYQFSNYTIARDSFSSLWASIYGPDSWAANPLVWVCEFKKVTP